MRFIIAQAVGFVAMALGILSFQFNDRKKLLTIQVVMAVVWAVHFFLLGENTGMILNVVGAVRFYVYSKRSDTWRHTGFVPYLFAAVFVVSGILTYESWFSILPMLAMVLSSFVMWSKNTSLMRYMSVPVSLLWVVYDAVSRSIPGVLNEIFVIVSILVAVIRFDIPRLGKKASGDGRKQ